MYHVIQRYARLLALVLFLGVGLAFTSTPAVGQVDITPGVRVGISGATAGGNAQEMGALFTSLATGDPAPSNFSGISGEVIGRGGLLIGGFAIINFGAPVALQPEIRWIQKGYATEYNTGFGQLVGVSFTNTVQLSYVEIPVLARFDVPFEIAGFAPHLFAGPTLGFNLGAESEYELTQDVTGLTEESADLKSVDELDGDAAIGGTDFGLEFGAGATYSVRGLATVELDIRYGLGLTNILNTDAFASSSPASDFSLTNQAVIISGGLVF